MQETVLLYNIDKTDAGKAIISILEKKTHARMRVSGDLLLICYLFSTFYIVSSG